jgi:DNA-binding PadR family transcriptional regulator
MLEFILLGFLKYGEMSGYQLKQCMAESTSNFFDASFGSIYPALAKMEKRGAITVRGVVEGGKYKKLYSITKEGAEEFMRWLKGPIHFSKIRPDHLVHIFFYGFLPKETALFNLNQFILKVSEVMDNLKKQGGDVDCKADGYMFSTLRFGIDYYSLIISWCEDLIKKIEGGGL